LKGRNELRSTGEAKKGLSKEKGEGVRQKRRRMGKKAIAFRIRALEAIRID